MTIEGDYTLFAHLETVYLGVLARRTLISTNTERVLRAANGKPIIFMPARHDHHRVQTGDGYAAYVAGAMLGTRDRRHLGRAGVVVGWSRRRHRPACADRRRTAATPCSRRRSSPTGPPADLHITVLVDFENDSVATALAVADALGPQALGRAARHVGPARRPLALGGDGRLRPARRQRAARPQGARRARRRRAYEACASSRPADSRSRRSRSSSGAASRSTPTASARR